MPSCLGWNFETLVISLMAHDAGPAGCIDSYKDASPSHIHHKFTFIPWYHLLSVLTPFLYLYCFILYKILSEVALFRTCCSRIGKLLQATNDNQHQDIQRGSTEDLPDRIVNQATNSSSSGEGDSQGDFQPQAGVNSLVPYCSM